MPWPQEIILFFDLAKLHGDTDQSRFYGPYNALLNYLFPTKDKFMVVPQWKRPEQSKATDFTTIFVVRHDEHPVFFLEVKASNYIQRASTRQAADQQMRERYYGLFDDTKIKVLYGLSAIGTKLCFYTWVRETRIVQPKAIPLDPDFPIDTAPENRWNLDLLTAEGEEKLRQVIAHIKVLCGTIQS